MCLLQPFLDPYFSDVFWVFKPGVLGSSRSSSVFFYSYPILMVFFIPIPILMILHHPQYPQHHLQRGSSQ